ncbi:MAG: GGDEF domain-containing protein [bacterium]
MDNFFRDKKDTDLYREIKLDVSRMRVVTSLFFGIAYIILARDSKYFFIPIIFGIFFVLSQVIRYASFNSPWIPFILSLLINISTVINTGIQRSPFILLFLIPVITHGIEREPIWALRIAVVNTFFLVVIEIYSAICRDFFGIAYINSIIVLMYFLSRIIMKSHGSLLIYAVNMEEMAHLDPLTGLYNRRALEKYIDTMISTRTPFTLMMCDLDGFKRYNDTYGHQAGDIALKRFASLLKESIRSTDLSFRYGGDEFVIVLPGELNDVKFLCDRIRDRLKKSIKGIDISFGLSVFPKNGNSLDKILATADVSLYEAKRKSKGKMEVSDGDITMEEDSIS